jgi:hypothetical protein
MQAKAREVRRRVNAVAGSVRISVTELAKAARVERSLLSKFLTNNVRTLPVDQLERIEVEVFHLAMKRLAATLRALSPKPAAKE